MPGSSGSRLFTSARPSASRYSSHGANACSSWRRETPSRIGISAWTCTSCRMVETSRGMARFYLQSTPKIPASMLPDYAGGGLLNLMSSIAAACGGRAFHPALAALAPDALSAAENVVLLVMDGVGDNYLQRRGGGGGLARRRRGAMSSVFQAPTPPGLPPPSPP